MLPCLWHHWSILNFYLIWSTRSTLYLTSRHAPDFPPLTGHSCSVSFTPFISQSFTLTSNYLHCMGDFILIHDFQYHPVMDNTHIYICSSQFSPELHIHLLEVTQFDISKMTFLPSQMLLSFPISVYWVMIHSGTQMETLVLIFVLVFSSHPLFNPLSDSDDSVLRLYIGSNDSLTSSLLSPWTVTCIVATSSKLVFLFSLLTHSSLYVQQTARVII